MDTTDPEGQTSPSERPSATNKAATQNRREDNIANHLSHVGLFTAENIAAVPRALPETDATYQKVVRQASEYDVNVSLVILVKWVSSGRADIRTNERQTAYAKFAQHYDQLKREHCGPDAARNR